jgi:hypothetical protein
MRFVIVILMAAAALALPAGAIAGTPTLRIASAKPFVVTGKSFKPHERVIVTLWTSRRAVRTVATDGAGSFTADFGVVTFHHCVGFMLSAVGMSGDRAVLKIPRPACMPRNP